MIISLWTALVFSIPHYRLIKQQYFLYICDMSSFQIIINRLSKIYYKTFYILVVGAAVGDCLCCRHLNTFRIKCIFLKTCVLTNLIWAIYSLISMLKTGDQAFSPKMDFKRLKGPKFKRTKAPKWVLWQNLFAENNQFQFLQNTLRRMDWDASEHNAGKWQMLKFRWKYESMKFSGLANITCKV